MQDSLTLSSLAGWSIKDWSIRPKMLMTINFVLRRYDGRSDGPYLCKLMFSRPEQIIFSDLRPSPNVGLVVSSLTENYVNDSSVVCRMNFEEGGDLIIKAWKRELFFW
jgi:hypothetical protein